MNKLKQHIIYILILLVLLGMDQISKNWAISTLKNGEDFILINSILHLSYLENTGVAFSILRNHSYLILILGICIVAILLWIFFVKTPSDNSAMKLILAILIAGAIGNLIDRIRYGFVVDFIYFVPIDFPKFNIADVYIVLSSIAFVLLYLFTDRINFSRDA